MLRTTLANSYIRRTFRPLYAFEHGTARDMLLDPNWNKATSDIYPGMALMHASTAASGAGDVVSPIDATGVVIGLAGQYVAPAFGIDELADAGVNSIAVWTLAPGSEYEVIAPAFDSAATFTFPTNGTALLLHAYTGAGGSVRGKLAPAGSANITTKPVARVISRPATDRIIIAGLTQSDVYG